MPEQPAFDGPAAFGAAHVPAETLGRDHALTRDHVGSGFAPQARATARHQGMIPRATYWRAVIFSLMRAALPLKWRV
jgi:hypothetical protein